LRVTVTRAIFCGTSEVQIGYRYLSTVVRRPRLPLSDDMEMCEVI